MKIDVKEYQFRGAESMVTPQLVYYKNILEKNIDAVIAVAGSAERLWPHVKSHKMMECVRLQLRKGITKFKCATIAEAEMVSQAGAGDAMVAYPLVGPNVRRFLELQDRYPDTRFWAIGDSTEAVEQLSEQSERNHSTVRLLMDVDMGMHRTGVAFDSVEELYTKWASFPGITMKGFHCYDGNRHERDHTVRREKVREADQKVQQLRNHLTQSGLDCSILVFGGTPSFPCHAEITGDYLSPGTGIIQDYGYLTSFPDIVLTPGAVVLTRVISHPGRNLFTCDLGYKAVAADPSGERAVILGYEFAKTVFQNEEHWVLSVPEAYAGIIPEIGTELYCVPTHICPTSALYPAVPVVENGAVCGWWEVTARNRKISI